MGAKLDIIGSELLQLPESDRRALIKTLLDSLDVDAELDELWFQEIERREAEIDSGESAPIEVDSAFAQVRASLGFV
jgi:putative addiction module component (TIGR02574 family)